MLPNRREGKAVTRRSGRTCAYRGLTSMGKWRLRGNQESEALEGGNSNHFVFVQHRIWNEGNMRGILVSRVMPDDGPRHSSQFTRAPVRVGRTILILSTCNTCDASKLVSHRDGSLEDWELEHRCEWMAQAS